MDTYHMNKGIEGTEEIGKYAAVFVTKGAEEKVGESESCEMLKSKDYQKIISQSHEEQYRFNEVDANKSEFVKIMLSSEAMKVNLTVEKEIFKKLGFIEDDITEFIELINSIKMKTGDNTEYIDMAKQIEIFLKLSSRGNLSRVKLWEVSQELVSVFSKFLKNNTIEDCELKSKIIKFKNRVTSVRSTLLSELSKMDHKNFSVFAEEYIFSDDEASEDTVVAEARYERMERVVTNLVSFWNAKEDYKDKSVDVSRIVDSLKKKLVNENMQKLLVYFFPQSTNITNYFASGWTLKEAVKREGYLTYLKTPFFSDVMIRFAEGLDQMMGDVVYWAVCKGATTLEGFELCNSDLHERGLGACKIDLGDKGKYVIKPDRREFEHRLLDSESGFVKIFNKEVAKGAISEIKDEKCHEVKSIEMKISENHGTLVEQISFHDIKEVEKTDVDATQDIKTRIFCALFGLYDLNHENVGYYNDDITKKIILVLIDAECGVGLDYIGNLKKYGGTAAGGFFERNGEIAEKYQIDTQLLDGIIGVIAGVKARKLVWDTAVLGERRKVLHFVEASDKEKICELLEQMENAKSIKDLKIEGLDEDIVILINALISQQDKIFTLEKQEVAGFLGEDVGEYFESTSEEKLNLVRCAIEDFRKGIIPFYYYEPSSGKVTTHGDVQVGQYMRKSTPEQRIEFIKKLIKKIIEKSLTSPAATAAASDECIIL